MKRIATLLTLSMLALLLLACNNEGETAQEATPLPPVIQSSTIVSAEGFLIPARYVDLSFEVGGRLVELNAVEGETVDAGQVIARLNDEDQQIALASAEANRSSTEVGLNIAAAGLLQAEASFDQTLAGATEEQIAQAEAGVLRAQANLAQVATGPRDEDIAVAEARVDTLQAQLNQVLAGTRDEQLTASLATVRRAEAALRLAQAEYDRIAYAADGERAEPVALALEQATLDYEAALANYQALLNGATSQEVAIAQASLAEGEAALAQVKVGASAENIAVAQAGVIEAEAGLDAVAAGPTDEQIAVAEAAVAQAEANIEQAEAAIEQADVGVSQAELALNKVEMQAPFAGTIANLEPEVGELVSAGQPFATLADFSTWYIETDDLTEIDVVKVREGQTVNVTFDSLPNQSFSGVVERIKDRSEVKAGDVTYTVIIRLDDLGDAPLRWGMTAFVEIDTE